MFMSRPHGIAAPLLLVVGSTSAQQRSINFNLPQSARTGSVARSTALLDQSANQALRNRLGDSPLNTRARNGKVELIEFPLENGADVVARDNHGAFTRSLEVAKRSGRWIDRCARSATGSRTT